MAIPTASPRPSAVPLQHCCRQLHTRPPCHPERSFEAAPGAAGAAGLASLQRWLTSHQLAGWAAGEPLAWQRTLPTPFFFCGIGRAGYPAHQSLRKPPRWLLARSQSGPPWLGRVSACRTAVCTALHSPLLALKLRSTHHTHIQAHAYFHTYIPERTRDAMHVHTPKIGRHDRSVPPPSLSLLPLL